MNSKISGNGYLFIGFERIRLLEKCQKSDLRFQGCYKHLRGTQPIQVPEKYWLNYHTLHKLLRNNERNTNVLNKE